ncbi:MAG TPA: 16S rRNA (cytosine(967)-C(5))-methyltransferase RsmB [Candidatus Enterocloster faecavium]|uniref:16S rRNA (cytosine(967)-C(5))-methyltransferase n=1 Tax=Candidatus Enterocloster faecavium TaxID=2838560 RepID=A0A9D2L5Q5_9FIRM|nr:16S rRNA (cytosine(967)-C(5))-methyltransferase RsmB [Candidatus Enterocloster faecavium]
MAKKIDRGLENREIVLDVLLEVLEKGNFVHLVLNQALKKYQYLEKADRAFITRVTEGTLDALNQMDDVINRYSKMSTQKMKPVIRNLLRLSVYQILYMDRVPDSAVCNEAVKLAAKRHFAGLKGFVNGVLRTIARNKETIVFQDPWVELCLPEWLYKMWFFEYGGERTAAMARSFLKEGATTVRVKPEKIEEAMESLKKQGVTVKEEPLFPGILYLKNYDYLESLDAFQNGWLQVQDLSSALVGKLAPPQKGSLVLDVCAAPGGKSLHMAELMMGSGQVEAQDVSDRKTALIEENARRGGFENVVCRTWDARVLDESMVEKADLVLADLPCSGLGILGKKPDIKWRMSPEQMKELEALQREILSVVWRYVKPGGRLVYSTCTVNPGENQKNAKWFEESFPFEPVDLSGRLGPDFGEESLKNGWIQLLPGIHPGDGFFISVFRKKEQ